MDPLHHRITNYFRDIQTRSNLQDYRFTSDDKFASVPLETLRSGTLPPDVTSLFIRRSGTERKRKPVDVVISLVTLQIRGKKEGLLLLPATLDENGSLSVDLSSSEPWIPASRLTTPGIPASGVTVGSLKTFWQYRLNEWTEAVTRIESWSDAVDACLTMFSKVADDSLEVTAGANSADVLFGDCFLSAETVITANGAVLDLYAHLLSLDEKTAVPTYERLLSLTDRPRCNSDIIDDETPRLLRAALASCGSMDDEHPLTDSQRRAVHAFLSDADGDVTAVSGPPGTGKTTMLQSVVAGMLVRRALDGRPAPLIVCTSTNNQAVTNVIDSFSSVVKKDPGTLDLRWLPEANDDSDTGVTSKPLSALATYCPSRSKAQEIGGKYLVEDTRKSGIYSRYSAPDYVSAATARFLERMQAHASSTGGVIAGARTLSEARDILGKALHRIEDNRRILLTEKADAEVAAGPRMSRRLAAEILDTKDQRKPFRARGRFWEARRDEAEAAQPNRDRSDDHYVVEQNYDDDEPAPRFDTIDDFVAFYGEKDAELTRRISDLDVVREQKDTEEAAAMAMTPAAERALGWLRRLGAVTTDGEEKIRESVNLIDLDRSLDTTVRYAEFWVAVHLYEAQWLLFAAGEDAHSAVIPVAERNRTTRRYMEQYWGQVTALTPCFVMTAYQLPKYFKLWTRNEDETDYDLGRADLLIMDESGQVDTSVGAAAFAVAKRALVVGDVRQLAPVWSIDPDSDRQIAPVLGLSEPEWEAMTTRGLTSSDHSSVMAAAASASNWSYGADADPGLFLSEHFRCHPGIINYCNDLLYKGMLIPTRGVEGYKLKDRTVSPFLFHEVAGSESRRSGSSRVNDREADAVARWIIDNFNYFADIYDPAGQSPDEVIGVVTPFAAQARLISQKIRDLGGTGMAEKITVGTAHRLQGAERPVVLFSSVYGDRDPRASFIDNTLELMNVAVSRAKDLFIVFGGRTRWSDQGEVFSLIHRYATKNDCDFAGTGTAGQSPAPEAPTPDIPTVGSVSTAPAGTAVPTYRTVARSEPGYAIAHELVSSLVLPPGSTGKPSAKTLNAALEKAGYINRPDGHRVPTASGTALGIAVYEGTSQDGEPYVNLIYSPEAQEALQGMVTRGELVL